MKNITNVNFILQRGLHRNPKKTWQRHDEESTNTIYNGLTNTQKKIIQR